MKRRDFLRAAGGVTALSMLAPPFARAQQPLRFADMHRPPRYTPRAIKKGIDLTIRAPYS